MASTSNIELGDDKLDPRIKGELDALNSAAESINKLENEIQKARSLFKKHKMECANSLRMLSHKIGKKTVAQAQGFYDAVKKLNKLQLEVEKAACRFQKASSLYKTAQETVSLAEQQLTSEDGSKLAFDTAWQEMLNHANLRFMDAEKEKRACEDEYETCSKDCSRLQFQIAIMKKDMAKAIEKSRQFYEMKQKFEKKLQIEKQNAEDLQLALICSKQKYKLALINLEQISEEIHMQRDRSELPRRTPGVGAESDACSELSDIFSTNLDFISDNSSQVSRGDFASDFCLDESWESGHLEENEKALNNTLDTFFDKVSRKFQRSSSMGNIALGSQLQVPGLEKAPDDVAESFRGNISARDSNLEGAEQAPEQSESLKGHPSKIFKSTIFLPISYPIDKARQDVKRATLLSLERGESYRSQKGHVDSFQSDLKNLKLSHKSSNNLPHKSSNNLSLIKTQHLAERKAYQIDKSSGFSYSTDFTRKDSF